MADAPTPAAESKAAPAPEHPKPGVGDEDPLVLVTGVSGYIGAHVAKVLLERGYRVRGTTRSTKNAKKVASLKAICPGAKHELELVELDLLNAEAWHAAVKGCTYVQHIASPFIIGNINEAEMVRTAVEGTTNVLKACAATNGAVKHVVFTSSIVSVAEGHEYVKGRVFTEKDWTIPEKAGPYPKSKVLAERAAWDFHKTLTPEQHFDLSCVNPSFVMGPPLMKQSSASIDHMVNLFTNALPALPDIRYEVVDVRDVAAQHVLLMETHESNGERYLCSSAPSGMRHMAKTLADFFNPRFGYKIKTGHLPYAAMWVASFWDKAAAGALHSVGKPQFFSTAKARALGMTYRPIEETILEMGYGLIRWGIVEDKSPNHALSSGVAPSPLPNRRGSSGTGAGAGAGAGAGSGAGAKK